MADIQQLDYDAADVFDDLEKGDTVRVETTGTAGSHTFTATVVKKTREDLLGDAVAVYIQVENSEAGWMIHATRDSPEDSYGTLYADGRTVGQRVESIEVTA